MQQKNKLLTIGEISKLTGAHIKSLRYYERINILKPVYVDPDSGYRYYSFDQAYLVEIIKFAIAMDIPLNKFAAFIDQDGTMDFQAFALYSQEVAEKKINFLQHGLNIINFFKEQIELQAKQPQKQIYTKEFAAKHFYIKPYQQAINDQEFFAANRAFFETLHYKDDDDEWPEYGVLVEYLSESSSQYTFLEIPASKVQQQELSYKVMPAGQYYCYQSDTCQIEDVKEVFCDYLADKDAFIAIETEVFSGTFNINQAIYELRVIAL